ncbi:hypothetical protein D3C86_1572590 [compost metagenome]
MVNWGCIGYELQLKGRTIMNDVTMDFVLVCIDQWLSRCDIAQDDNVFRTGYDDTLSRQRIGIRMRFGTSEDAGCYQVNFRYAIGDDGSVYLNKVNDLAAR